MNHEQDLDRLEAALGHHFRDRQVLRRALTHSSRAQDEPAEPFAPGEGAGKEFDNEKLEFLGDAILGFLTSEMLLERFPSLQEGQLSRIKANLVSARQLHRLARGLNLGDCLRLGRGEEKTGGRLKPALLADALEALIAALYLDGGLPAARQFIDQFFFAGLDRGAVAELLAADHKSALQEYLQAQHRPAAHYVVVQEEGPEHQKSFTVELRLDGQPLARASASTKKAASQEAARLALAALQQKDQRSS